MNTELECRCYFVCYNLLIIIIGITGHWVDSRFELHDALLRFEKLKGSHTGVHLAEAIYDTLDTYNIVEKLFCITTDNASNNTSALKHLQHLMVTRKGIVWKAREHHIRCMNYIINIGVQKFLETCKVLGESSPEFEDEDLNMNDDDAEEATMDELDERDAAEQIQARSEYAEEVADAATHFKYMMYKLREIGKVRGCM